MPKRIPAKKRIFIDLAKGMPRDEIVKKYNVSKRTLSRYLKSLEYQHYIIDFREKVEKARRDYIQQIRDEETKKIQDDVVVPLQAKEEELDRRETNIREVLDDAGILSSNKDSYRLMEKFEHLISLMTEQLIIANGQSRSLNDDVIKRLEKLTSIIKTLSDVKGRLGDQTKGIYFLNDKH